MARRKAPIEYASDVGSAAYNLYQCAERDVDAALDVLWHVNPALFTWLHERLTLASNRASKTPFSPVSGGARTSDGRHEQNDKSTRVDVP